MVAKEKHIKTSPKVVKPVAQTQIITFGPSFRHSAMHPSVAALNWRYDRDCLCKPIIQALQPEQAQPAQ